MSGHTNEIPSELRPVGNLKNRVDTKLKLSIPKTDFNSPRPRQPATAPGAINLKYQFSDLPIMKNLMKNWDHGDDGKLSAASSSSDISEPDNPIRLMNLSHSLLDEDLEVSRKQHKISLFKI